MTAIWSPENRYRIWWQIEVFAAEAMGRIGMIPVEDASTIRKAYDDNVLGEIDVPAIDAIEAVTKHDVIAFLTWVETGSTVSPIFSATQLSTNGSILANVPTAPEMAQVAISARALTSRSRQRVNSA